jgi:peptide deformylase
MIFRIVQYGDPVLRKKGAKISPITAEHRKLARDMLETMHENNGIGLAAQQIGKALQLAVIDVSGTERPSQLFVGVREVPVESLMPMVLINPVITHPRGEEHGAEGCLSFPGIALDIARAHEVTLEAADIDGKLRRFTCTGLLARAVQHEIDHLNGVLFIDRASPESLEPLQQEIEAIKKNHKRRN